MRTLLVTVLALTFSAPVLAQRPGFALGFTTSTDVYRYKTWEDAFASGPNYQFRLRNSVGVQAHYVTTTRIAFTTGLLLSNKGAYYDYTDYGLIIGRAGTRYTVDERHLYLDVPLKLGYNWRLTDRLALTPTSGAIISTALSTSYVVTKSNGDRVSRRNAIRTQPLYRLSIPLELHLDWLVSERIVVSAAPYYRFDVRLEPYHTRLPSYGLLLDLRYYLK
ncbi:MAG: outer membrane beta-barrel protein [Hymenobacteraceae bacterium]|nr:outer membrane beta-barrel protein [Hymenobacteraceae bacterium]